MIRRQVTFLWKYCRSARERGGPTSHRAPCASQPHPTHSSPVACASCSVAYIPVSKREMMSSLKQE